MTNDNRVNPGIPTGGQFAAKAKAEGDVMLPVKPPAAEAYQIAVAAARNAVTAQRIAGLSAIREAGIAYNPRAVSAVFSDWSDADGDMLVFSALLDANGDVCGRKSDIPAIHEFTDALTGEFDFEELGFEKTRGRSFILNFDKLG